MDLRTPPPPPTTATTTTPTITPTPTTALTPFCFAFTDIAVRDATLFGGQAQIIVRPITFSTSV